MAPHSVCPYCGTELPAHTGRGRPRIWCSADCRKRAFEDRQRATAQGNPVRVVEVQRDSTDATRAVEAALANARRQIDELRDELAAQITINRKLNAARARQQARLEHLAHAYDVEHAKRVHAEQQLRETTTGDRRRLAPHAAAQPTISTTATRRTA